MGAFQDYIYELDRKIDKYKNENENVTDIEILRLIYIDLGQKMGFDPHYTFGNSKQKQAIYDRISNENEFDEMLEKKEAICKSIAYMFDMILSRYGFNSNVVFERDDRGDRKKRAHVYNVIKNNDGKKFIVDLVEDFEYIQTGSKTKSFAVSVCDEVTCLYSDEEMRRIDQKIGYIPEGIYMDDILWMMDKAVENCFADDDLFEFIIDNFNKYFDIRNMGYVVRTHYYDRMIEHFFNRGRLDANGKRSFSKIERYDCYRVIDGERRYVPCIITTFKGEKIYLFDYEDDCFKKVSAEEFIYMAHNGLEVPQKGRANKLKRAHSKMCSAGQEL